MPTATALNLVPIVVIGGGLIAGVVVGLLKKPKKKLNWLWYGLTGLGSGLVVMLLLGLLDFLRSR